MGDGNWLIVERAPRGVKPSRNELVTSSPIVAGAEIFYRAGLEKIECDNPGGF